jgi:ribosomal protein L11 methyltransferase
MNYFEYQFELNPLLPAREVLVAELAEIGFESFVETENGVLAYIPVTGVHDGLLDNLLTPQLEDQQMKVSAKEIQDENWNAEWEKNFSPITVEDLCMVRAPFHSPASGFSVELIVEPKMSFGTGHHATTWMMLRTLFELDLTGKTVLDMGSGTGVLAILAEKLGAAHTDAIDNDEWAYENALENVTRNGCSAVTCLLGDAGLLGERKYDVIIANINRNILTRDAEAYLRVLAPGGTILLSGFYTHDIPLIAEAFRPLQISGELGRESWAMVRMTG